ncbi:hypothetical protein D1114_23035 [Cereibacter sphaeroides]|uniref:Uncharacterized protein n=1 Tax=Cereibacter sphaeroides TaxID=1063 RepID=A0AAX1UEX3_CERSP|nr:hypothetical protein D1114_23035 [Cereibacter sphaeroides]
MPLGGRPREGAGGDRGGKRPSATRRLLASRPPKAAPCRGSPRAPWPARPRPRPRPAGRPGATRLR